MFILRPDLNEEQVNQQRKKYYDFLKEHGADQVAINVWGKRRLAYPIQRFQDGIYILTNFTGDGSQVAPIEREMRLSDEVIRYLTLKLKNDLEIEETVFSQVSTSEPKPKPEIEVNPPVEEVPRENVTDTIADNEGTQTPETAEVAEESEETNEAVVEKEETVEA
jgi:small subunit ribosomal protein S6